MFTGFVAIFIFPTVKDGIIAYPMEKDNLMFCIKYKYFPVFFCTRK